jgi:hypothetical protein
MEDLDRNDRTMLCKGANLPAWGGSIGVGDGREADSGCVGTSRPVRRRDIVTATTGPTRTAAAIKSLRRSIDRLADAVLDAYAQVPWYSALPQPMRAWVAHVVSSELKAMTENLYLARSPMLQSVFADVPGDITEQLSLDQIVELTELTVDVVLAVLDDVMDPASAAELRRDLERYGREVGFKAARVYAKAADNRCRNHTEHQKLLIDAVVNGTDDQIADRATGLIPLDIPVLVVGLTPTARAAAAVLRELDRRGAKSRQPTCAAKLGPSVLAVIPVTATDLVTELAAFAGGVSLVRSDPVASVTGAGPAATAVLYGLRALAALPAPPPLVEAADLLPERVLCGDPEAARRLVGQCYAPLASAGRGLVETVDALLDHDGSPEAAARSIPVHVNTLRYRLDKVIRLTGRDPRRLRDAFVLRMAFTLARTTASALEAATIDGVLNS